MFKWGLWILLLGMTLLCGQCAFACVATNENDRTGGDCISSDCSSSCPPSVSGSGGNFAPNLGIALPVIPSAVKIANAVSVSLKSVLPEKWDALRGESVIGSFVWNSVSETKFDAAPTLFFAYTMIFQVRLTQYQHRENAPC
jgi:hypothetical protein